MPDLKPAEAKKNGNGHSHHQHAQGEAIEAKGRVGHPPKLTKKAEARFIKAILGNNPIMNACKLAGFSHSAYKQWKRRASINSEPKYVAFMSHVDEALAKAQENLIKMVRVAGKRDWRAAAWMLERRHQDEWEKRETIRQEISGPDKGPIQTETKDISIERSHLERMARQIIGKRDTVPVNGNGG